MHQPIFYPVVCFVTGTTPRGGGIWKDVLYGSPYGLLHRNFPLMTSALHFLDFRISSRALDRWRQKPLREHYTFAKEGAAPLRWEGELFVDSGGFALILDPHLNLSRYGIPPDQVPEGILALQLAWGADRIASLDWPIPPGLHPEEARRRMDKTLEAALRTGRVLGNLPAKQRPQWMVPVHGPTPEALEAFIRQTIERLRAEGLLSLVSGLAVGSMVPRRQNGWVGEILAFVRAARRATPEDLPLHVFGMTGAIIPFLLQEGGNSFDSTAYIQEARHLKYIDPQTRRRIPLRALGELSKYPCDCPVCAERDPREDLAVLRGERPGRKSAVYAALALHNLEMDLRLFQEASEALRAGVLNAFLRELPRRFPSLRWPEPHRRTKKIVRVVRHHSPDDFDLRRIQWQPSPEKRVLLLLPCSKEKPYTVSSSFRRVWRVVEESLGEKANAVQVVFLSGLYGPVPLEHAEEEAVVTYDFRLHPADKEGIARVARRLEELFHRVQAHFDLMVAFVPSPAYRKAVQRATRTFPQTVVFDSWKKLPELQQWLQYNVKNSRPTTGEGPTSD